MPLTPEDVLNKTFGTTQFRRGYDEREVDDFLDEVVASLRSLTTELDECRAGVGAVITDTGAGGDGELRAKLQREIALRKEAERALAQLQEQHRAAGEQAAAAQPSGELAAAEREQKLADLDARVQQTEQEAEERIAAAQGRAEEAEAQARARIEDAEARAQQRIDEATALADDHAAAAQPAPAAETGEPVRPGTATADASGLIALAQRVHDEYVAQGESTRDQLITEAQTRHDTLLAEASELSDHTVASAREEAAAILGAATQERDQVLGDLEGQRAGLEVTIERLRAYEQDYRGQIRDYFNDQLRRVDELSWQPPATAAGPGSAEGLESGDGTEPRVDAHEGASAPSP